jgi:hypothetical protein
MARPGWTAVLPLHRTLLALLLFGLAAAALPTATATCAGNRAELLVCAASGTASTSVDNATGFSICIAQTPGISCKAFLRVDAKPVEGAALAAVLCPVSEGSLLYCYVQ